MDDLSIEDFIRLETEVWCALVSGDALADARLLSDDFLGVYPSAFADRSDHVGQLADGPTIAEFEFSEERLLTLSDSVALFAYRAVFRRPRSAEASEREAMYVCQFVVVPPKRPLGQRLQPGHAATLGRWGAIELTPNLTRVSTDDNQRGRAGRPAHLIRGRGTHLR